MLSIAPVMAPSCYVMADPEPKYAALGNRLYEARLRAGPRQRPIAEVSQERMADLVTALVGRRISQAVWSYWESGKREPELDVIRAVAVISGLTPEYIAFGPPEPERPAPPSELAPADAPERAKAARKRRRTG
jgi:transcriptional regulator with XRE-family HTH domain